MLISLIAVIGCLCFAAGVCVGVSLNDAEANARRPTGDDAPDEWEGA